MTVAVGLALLLAAGGPLWWRGRLRRVQADPAVLRGVVVAVDPGHGGPDPGAVGGRGIREKDVVLAIALEVRNLLLEAGARPVLTRTEDRNLSDRAVPGLGSARRGELAARAQVAADAGAAIFVSIHANEFGKRTPWQGAQVFYDPRGHPEGARLARALQAELASRTHTRRLARPIEQFVLARVPVPAATVEVGFLSNPKEEAMLADPGYQRRLAGAIVAGIARYVRERTGEGR